MTTTCTASMIDLSRRRARAAFALAWLGAGLPALLLTSLPLHDRLFGWSAAFWLVGAPLVLLAVLAPRLPLALLRTAIPCRRRVAVRASRRRDVRPPRGACAACGAGTLP